MRLPVRQRVAGRRSKPVSRASFWISRTRLFGAIGLAAVSGAFYWLTVSEDFALDQAAMTIDGTHYTDADTIRERMGLAEGAAPNIFRLPTQAMRRAIESLPAVLSADVDATLPDRLAVVVHERTPIFVWQQGASAWFVDREGLLFASAPLVSEGADAALPSIVDRRTSEDPAEVGTRLDAVDLEASRTLGALTPEAIGSTASAVQVGVEDESGWVITSDLGWRAVFGHFTPSLHTTAEIPQQVQCLRSLLAEHEAEISQVTLAVGPDRCGTYLPAASASPAPGTSEAPSETGRPQPSKAP